MSASNVDEALTANEKRNLLSHCDRIVKRGKDALKAMKALGEVEA